MYTLTIVAKSNGTSATLDSLERALDLMQVWFDRGVDSATVTDATGQTVAALHAGSARLPMHDSDSLFLRD